MGQHRTATIISKWPVIEKITKILFRGKLQSGILWNFGGLCCTALVGIILQISIARYYSVQVLGVFNQVYAIFVLFSQIAVCGIHNSTLHFVARQRPGSGARKPIILSAFIAGTISSGIVTLSVWLAKDLAATILDSPHVSLGLLWALPGLFLFALNKILMAALNGMRRMKNFAFMQILRAFSLLISLLISFAIALPGYKLPIVLTCAELMLFVVLILFFKKTIFGLSWVRETSWMLRHYRFGLRSLASGILAEMHNKVDILMLGYFCSDKLVGIYSFAAIAAEGVYQLPVIIRTNVNPLLASIWAEKRLKDLRNLLSRLTPVVYCIMAAVCITAVLLFPHLVLLVTGNNELVAGWPAFGILMVGIFAASGYMPFGQILLQFGYPGWHSLLIIAVLCFNVVANAFLIPNMQELGAATATSSAWLFTFITVRYLARRLSSN